MILQKYDFAEILSYSDKTWRLGGGGGGDLDLVAIDELSQNMNQFYSNNSSWEIINNSF